MAQVPPDGAPNAGPNVDTAFVKPGDKFWSLYIEDAEKYDKVRLERWKGDTDGILIFTGLFAATVATFVVSTIPNLSPDSGDQTAVLLSQVISALVNHTESGALPASAPPDYSFKASVSTVWVNSLWLVSLFLSLVCALAATLVQQWARAYLQQVQCRGKPTIRGPVYAALATEIESFHMEDAITWIISMLHIAVLLFFAGLLVMISSIDRRIGFVLAAFSAAGALGYVVLTLLPIATYRSPYRTPLTSAIRRVVHLAMVVSNYQHILFWVSGWIIRHSGNISLFFRLDQDQVTSWVQCYPLQALHTISAAHRRLRAGSVAKNVSGWTVDEWTRYHYEALKQLYKSVDQLNEAEGFRDALTSLLSALDVRSEDRTFSTVYQPYVICEIAVGTLNIIDLLPGMVMDMPSASQGLESSASQSLLGSVTSHGPCRRVISVMTLARALLRYCNDSYAYEVARGTYKILAHDFWVYDLWVVDMIPYSLLNSTILSMSYKISYNYGGPYQPTSVLYGYYLAAIRADLFLICLDRLYSDRIPEHLKGLLFRSLPFSDDAWLHIMFHYRSESEDNWVPRIKHMFLDNFLWIYDRTITISSVSGGVAILSSLQSFWIPHAEYSFHVAFRQKHLPGDLRLLTRSINDLRNIAHKRGLDQDITSNSDDEEWLSKLADQEYVQTHVDHQYTPLFQNHTELAYWISEICYKIKVMKECERNSPPAWMKRIRDPFEIDTLDSVAREMLDREYDWYMYETLSDGQRVSALDASVTASPSLPHTSQLAHSDTPDLPNLPEIQNAPDMPVATRKPWTVLWEAIRTVFNRPRIRDGDNPMDFSEPPLTTADTA